jgi:Zn-dependent peptidase ImmA (M78 family)
LPSASTRYSDPRALALGDRYLCSSRDLSHDADRHLEREGNVFGAELLTPGAARRDAWTALRVADEVAALFEVSARAVQWRLYSFGLSERPP